ncbi:MAG: isocitrate lyase/phosphoenolpyruvate mutase family protein [Hyphomicrobiales bacterium]|nr:isocitrate lyase/phosphoenolpyruvate mutase family protein [Hyphomicrobiales bacterium]
MSERPALKQLITGAEILVAPGVYDALGAVLAQRAGFKAAYLSGASIAYTRFGRPDIGLVDMGEVVATLAAITERVDIPVVVDGDTGYGNALNVQRAVGLFERAGAAAVQLEDQTMPKRCGHLGGKELVAPGEMAGKIKAALDARRADGFLVIARTDAIAVEGFEAALDRAELYAEAGADVLFVEAPQTVEQMRAVNDRFRGRVPQMANMVEGGKTPPMAAPDLQDLGYAMVIFPGGLVRAFARMAGDYFASLAAHGSNRPFGDRMFDFGQLNDLLGTDDMLTRGQRYDRERFETDDD